MELVVILLLILLNGVFSMSETAVICRPASAVAAASR